MRPEAGERAGRVLRGRAAPYSACDDLIAGMGGELETSYDMGNSVPLLCMHTTDVSLGRAPCNRNTGFAIRGTPRRARAADAYGEGYVCSRHRPLSDAALFTTIDGIGDRARCGAAT